MKRHAHRAPRALPSASDRRSRLIGIGLMCAAVFCFTLLDTTGKWLNSLIPTLQVVWGRYAFHFILSLIFINPWTMPGLLRTKRPWLQFWRSVLLVAATAFNFFALRYLQLDQTSAIAFAAPFFVALCAGPMLGEWIGPRRWVAILVGFSGILLVTRPGSGGIHPAAVLSVGSALSYALYSLTTRMLAAYDSTETTVFYSALVGTLLSTLPLPFVWTTPSEPAVIGGMIFTGLFGWIGHLFLIMAHRRAPAAILAPFMYTQIIWMIAAGYLVFNNLPNEWTLAGVAIVIGSGLYLLYREKRMKAEDSIKAQTGE